jgi:predicted hydrocarbon binding protein/KaiC/GvpD/RAD55 family RecA-like ATPase
MQDVPSGDLILLAGPPGSGKSTFCQQAVLASIERRPVIYVTTETAPSKVKDSLRRKGLSDAVPHPLAFVDAFHETVGLASLYRPDVLKASSEDLTSMGIAISKLYDRMGERVLLIFDSLTSPYLMNQGEILRFIRTVLLRFAAEGNAVLACVDEGCGREEDLVAMMNVADGIVKMELEDDLRVISVVKHPELGPARFEMPAEPERILETRVFDPWFVEFMRARQRGEKAFVRSEVGDFVNLFWPNFARWSGMLWDPKKFLRMTYEVSKDDCSSIFKLAKEDEVVKRALLPWRERVLLSLFLPKKLERVKDVGKVSGQFVSLSRAERSGILEYLQDSSRTDEYHFRFEEGFDCWGFDGVGGTMAWYAPALLAGFCKALEFWKGVERDWNAVETKCIGLGDPYCEFKLVPGEIDGLKDSLEKDVPTIERIHERLMQRLVGYLLDGKPLVERRERLGNGIDLHPTWHAMGGEGIPAMGMAWSERYRMALRMGGTRTGKTAGEGLMQAGMEEGEAVKRVLGLLDHCKVGKVTSNGNIRMRESCESLWTRMYKKEFYRWKEPCCFFTTGFLNGFFSAVKNQHVKETKCIAVGDPYCEWEFR